MEALVATTHAADLLRAQRVGIRILSPFSGKVLLALSTVNPCRFSRLLTEGGPIDN
jgi:hypothetical protein